MKLATTYVRGYFLQGLDIVTTTLLEKSANSKGGTILQLFENIKN